MTSVLIYVLRRSRTGVKKCVWMLSLLDVIVESCIVLRFEVVFQNQLDTRYPHQVRVHDG